MGKYCVHRPYWQMRRHKKHMLGRGARSPGSASIRSSIQGGARYDPLRERNQTHTLTAMTSLVRTKSSGRLAAHHPVQRVQGLRFTLHTATRRASSASSSGRTSSFWTYCDWKWRTSASTGCESCERDTGTECTVYAMLLPHQNRMQYHSPARGDLG